MTSTNVGLETADQERFLEGLRALLGKGGKLKRALFGTLADDIEKAYLRIESLLREIRVYRGVTAATDDEQRLLKLREMVAQATTEKEFKKAKQQLEDLGKRLAGECEQARQQAESVPWGKARVAVLQAIEQAAATWATPERTASFRAYHDRLSADGVALAANPARARGPEGAALTARFEQLATRVGEARTLTTTAVKQWKDARDAVAKELAALPGLASPATRDGFEQRFASLGAAASERHQYEECARQGTALASEIAARLVALRQAKADYTAQLPAVQKAIADASSVVAGLVHGALHERLVAVMQRAGEGDHETAAPTLRTLATDVRAAVAKATADKQRYDAHAGHQSIPADLQRLRARHPQAAATLLGGIGSELATIQHVATTTRDHARGVQQLDELVRRVAAAATALAKSGPAFDAYEQRKAKYVSRWLAANTQLEAIAKNLGHLQPTALGERLEALEQIPLPTGDRTVDDARLLALETRLDAWEKDANACAKPGSDGFKALQQGEFERHEIAAQRKLYMAWRQRFVEAVTRLQTFGGADAAQAQVTFRELEAKAASENVADVTAAVTGLNTLHATVSKAWDEGVAKAKTLQQTLRDRHQAFTTRFQELGKRFQAIRAKDAAFEFRQSLQQQADELMQAQASLHQGVLQDAIDRMSQLLTSLDSTADDQGRQPILRIEAAKKAIDAALGDAALKKQMPQTRARLKAARDKLFEATGGTTPLDRAAVQLEDFRDDLQGKVEAAARIAEHKTALRAVRDEFAASFEQLGAKVRELKKLPANAKREVPGTNFGPLGEAHRTWLALASGEDETLYQQARSQVAGLRQRLADALRDPRGVFDDEQKVLAERARQAAALDLDKQRFQLELQRYRNVDLARAKAAVDRGGDTARLAQLAAMEKQMAAFVDRGDMDNARARLGAMSLLAQRLALDPQGASTSPNLANLGKRWARAVAGCGEAIVAITRRIGEECTKANDTPDGVAVLRREMPRATEGLAPDAFDAAIAVLIDSRSQRDARQRAREQGIAKVLEYQRHVMTDPMLKLLASNPFGVSFPAGALYAALNDLRFNLEISASS